MKLLDDSAVAAGGENDESDCFIGKTSASNQLLSSKSTIIFLRDEMVFVTEV